MKKSKIGENVRLKSEQALALNGHNVTVVWDTACHLKYKTSTVNVKCNVCGNTKEAYLSSVSRGIYLCNHCLICKYEVACEKLNLKFIEKFRENRQQKILTECKVCKTVCSSSSGHIMDGVFRCSGCLIEKQKAEMERKNLYADSGQDKSFAKCLICGALRQNGRRGVLYTSSKCENCTINKYKDCLAKKKCTFVSLERNPGGKSVVYYKNSNGDDFKSFVGYVTAGEFETSLNGHWSQHHSVYLIKLKVNEDLFIYKVGTANDPPKRAKDLKLNKKYEVFTLSSFNNRFEADRLEKEIHKEFKLFRLQPNVVEGHTDKFKSSKRSDGKYHRVKDGIT